MVSWSSSADVTSRAPTTWSSGFSVPAAGAYVEVAIVSAASSTGFVAPPTAQLSAVVIPAWSSGSVVPGSGEVTEAAIATPASSTGFAAAGVAGEAIISAASPAASWGAVTGPSISTSGAGCLNLSDSAVNTLLVSVQATAAVALDDAEATPVITMRVFPTALLSINDSEVVTLSVGDVGCA